MNKVKEKAERGPTSTRVVNLRQEGYDVYIGRTGKRRDGYFCKPSPCHGDIIKEYLDTQLKTTTE